MKERKNQERWRTWFVIPVQDGQSEEGSIAVGSEGRLGQRGQVVHVEEAGSVCVIVACQQQIHMVWRLRKSNIWQAQRVSITHITIKCIL